MDEQILNFRYLFLLFVADVEAKRHSFDCCKRLFGADIFKLIMYQNLHVHYRFLVVFCTLRSSTLKHQGTGMSLRSLSTLFPTALILSNNFNK